MKVAPLVDQNQVSKEIIKSIVIAVCVVFLQIVFQNHIFHCPDENYRHFSLVCFFSPAVPLFCIGWLSNTNLQNGIHGICYRCWNKVDRIRSWKRVRKLLFSIVLTSHLNAYVAPFCWFVMCLINKKIITCYTYGPPSINNTAEAKRRYATLETYSQLIGFNLLLITAAAVTIFITIQQCCKKVNLGKDVTEFEVLDNYASYEADAARAHFEEVMKQTAKENGRKKVQMLLEAKQPNLDHLQGVDRDVEEMSYDYLVDVRNSLMKIYPKLKNEYDRDLQCYTFDEWQKEEMEFRKVLHSTENTQTSDAKLIGHLGNNDRESIQLLQSEYKPYGYQATG